MTRMHASIKQEIVLHSMRSVRIPTSFANAFLPLLERKCDSRIRSVAKPGRTSLPLQDTHLGPVESPTESDLNQWIREGHTEAQFVEKQARKYEESSEKEEAISLETWDQKTVADVAIVGCGPAGLALAAEVASRGINVVLIGNDTPFVNNYGVWVDELANLGLDDALELKWTKAICYFGEEQEIQIERAYGRVHLQQLRTMLLDRCKKENVCFHEGMVSSIDIPDGAQEAILTCEDGSTIRTRMVTLASGAASGRFLKYEDDAPCPGAQTAYGMEVELEGYNDCYPPNQMLFMDYRRHHSGLWPGTACKIKKGRHPNGGDGLWDSHNEAPTFLYAMPLGENRVFLEETCLVAKPALPFAQLKTRLLRRVEAMGLKIHKVLDEEWSYIPVGGPLPLEDQPITAFGSAANMVHPASGYSVTRSLREAPVMANAIKEALELDGSVLEMSKCVWGALWDEDKRTQAAFHVFGMELLAQMELPQINRFFETFFKLPAFYWKGFLSASITSFDLLVFAIITFIIAPPEIKLKLITHLLQDPSGGYMMKKYFGKYSKEIKEILEKN